MSKTQLSVPNAATPRTISRRDDGRIEVTGGLTGDASLGARVHYESQNPANGEALITIPANKTFYGSVILVGTAAGGTLGVSAASGGSQATMVGLGIDTVDKTIAGGAGNALTATVSGGALGSVIVDGYIK